MYYNILNEGKCVRKIMVFEQGVWGEKSSHKSISLKYVKSLTTEIASMPLV